MSGFDISALEEQLDIDTKNLGKAPEPETPKEEEPVAPESEKEEPKAEEPEVDDKEDGESEEPETKEVKPETKAYQRRVSAREVEAMQKLHAVELENARLKALEEARTLAQPKQEEYVPDKDLEPEAYNAYRIQKLEEKLEQEAAARVALEQKQMYIELENVWLETDKRLRAELPAYSKAKEFLENLVREEGKRQGASEAEIKAGIKRAEYIEVSKLAKLTNDDPELIGKGLIMEAMRNGFNPITTVQPVTIERDKPKTDMRELNLHKRNAGSVAAVPTGGGKGRMTAQDLAQMTTLQDVFQLGSLSDKDWNNMAMDLKQ